MLETRIEHKAAELQPCLIQLTDVRHGSRQIEMRSRVMSVGFKARPPHQTIARRRRRAKIAIRHTKPDIDGVITGERRSACAIWASVPRPDGYNFAVPMFACAVGQIPI
jgi:hypothetical protein